MVSADGSVDDDGYRGTGEPIISHLPPLSLLLTHHQSGALIYFVRGDLHVPNCSCRRISSYYRAVEGLSITSRTSTTSTFASRPSPPDPLHDYRFILTQL